MMYENFKYLIVACGLSYEKSEINQSVKDVIRAFEELGIKHYSILYEIGDLNNLKTQILPHIDICFIIDAYFSENGKTKDLRNVLDELNITYTGSSAKVAELCRDKFKCLELFRNNGLLTPNYTLINYENFKELLQLAWDKLSFPLILKPRFEGGGTGVSLCHSLEILEDSICKLKNMGYTDYLVEEFIDGIEITIGVIKSMEGVLVLPPIELVLLFN